MKELSFHTIDADPARMVESPARLESVSAEPLGYCI